MELYIGGCGQGKLAYVSACCGKEQICVVEEQNWMQEDMALFLQEKQKEGGKVIWNHFHRWVKQQLEAGRTQEQLQCELQRILDKNPDLCVISEEVGNGIVPMERQERLYRECVGRLQCELAQKADKVVRIFCGIGQRIK